MKGGTMTRIALALAALLAALSLVAARQGRGLRVLSEVEDLESRMELQQAREDELVSRIRYLESRSVIVTRAQNELGMHNPEGEELQIWAGAGR